MSKTSHVDEFLEKFREQEAAFLRFQDGDPLPGDYMMLNGTEFQSKEQEHKSRLTGVKVRRSKAGTSKEWADAKRDHEAAKQKYADVTARNNPRIEQLQAELNRLRSENAEAASKEHNAAETVKVMAENREILKSKLLLPPVIVQEIILLENKALGAEGRKDLNQIMRDIAKLQSAGNDPDKLADLEREQQECFESFPKEIREQIDKLKRFYTADIE